MPTALPQTSLFSGDCTLVLFTKIPGKVPCKTRLLQSTPLAQDEVELLASAFLFDVLCAGKEATAGPFLAATSPAAEIDALTALFKQFPQDGTELPLPSIELTAQQGNSFGERLQHALESAFKRHKQGVVVIGSDAPTLSAKTIHFALERTAAGSFVLGPTPQGGLYLIGVPRTALSSGFSLASMFSGSRGTDLGRFVESIRKHEAPLTLLEPHFDIDNSEDLITLLSLLPAIGCSTLHSENPAAADAYNTASATALVLEQFGLEIGKDPADNRSTMLRRVKGVAH